MWPHCSLIRYRSWLLIALGTLVVACGQPNQQPSQTASQGPPNEVASSFGQTAGLEAEYFSTPDFSGPSQRQTDRNIEFNWGQVAAVRGMNPTQLSARWTGQLRAPRSGLYRFSVNAAGGAARVLLDGQAFPDAQAVPLTAGQVHQLSVEYVRSGTASDASLNLVWESLDAGIARQVVPGTALSHAKLDAQNVSTGSVPRGQNLLTNGDFEAGTAAWLGNVVRVPGQSGSGQAGELSNYGYLQQNLPSEATEVGAVYTLQASSKLSLAAPCSVGLAYSDLGGTMHKQLVPFAALAGSWQTSSLKLALPYGSNFITVYLGAHAGTCDFDNLSLQIAPTVIPLPTSASVLLNGNFETAPAAGTAVSNWSGPGKTISPGRSSAHALSLAAWGWTQQNLSSAALAQLAAGGPYSLTASAQALSGGACTVGFQGGNDSSVLFSTLLDFRLGPWATRSIAGSLPAGVKWAAVFVSSTSGECQFDDLLLGSSANPNTLAAAVYQNQDFGGYVQPFAAGTYNLPYGLAFNDAISSVKVGAGFQLRACRDLNLGGPCTSYAPGDYAFLGAGLDNTFSSLEIKSYVSGTSAAVRATMGEFSPVTPWPLIPVHAALNPDGQVMSWNSVDDDRVNGWYASPSNQTRTRVDLWTPASNAHRWINEVQGNDIFCAGFTHAADGSLITVGGNINQGGGISASFSFNYLSSLWKKLPSMSEQRWYSTATALASGEILAIGTYSDLPEVFNGKTWRSLTNARQSSYDEFFPWTQSAPNGKVFYAGPVSQLSYLDTAGLGNVTLTGQRDNINRDYGSYATYGTGKILVVGGGKSERSTRRIDLNGAAPVVSVNTDMKYGRRQQNLTILADGQVLATGGNSNGEPLIHKEAGVLPSEIWNPATAQWKTAASLSITRQYHSVALLLPDGRVMVGGGGYCCDTAAAPRRSGDSINSPNVEIFSPPYLFDAQGNLAQRPNIASAPLQITYAQSFSVALDNLGAGSSITKLHLLRLGSVTHSVNMEQRLTPLSFTGTRTALTVTAPANANITPPGYYMLIAVNNLGVPSVARMIKVGQATWTAGSAVINQKVFEAHLPHQHGAAGDHTEDGPHAEAAPSPLLDLAHGSQAHPHD